MVYLKRVIVTPAVYQLFTPLERGLKYWHWADITFYTRLYSFAECFVFVKQSDHPCHCALRSHPYGYECRDPFFRSYGTNLPISLNQFTLSHLRFLTQGHQCWFWVRIQQIYYCSLFKDSRNQSNRPQACSSIVLSDSHRYDTPRIYLYWHCRQAVLTSSKVSETILVLPRILLQ